MNYLSDLETKKRTWDSLRKKFRKEYSFVTSNCFDVTGLDVVQLDEDLDKHLVTKNLVESETDLEELSMKEKLTMFMVEEDFEFLLSVFPVLTSKDNVEIEKINLERIIKLVEILNKSSTTQQQLIFQEYPYLQDNLTFLKDMLNDDVF